MAGQIAEFFGYADSDLSDQAIEAATKSFCPFLSDVCIKTINYEGVSRIPSGACTVRQKSAASSPVICCPIRLYAEDYKLLDEIATRAFKKAMPKYSGRMAVEKSRISGEESVAVFGQRWGGELRLPQKDGAGSYFVDWILVHIDGQGRPVDFCAVEVQTIDTTGNYRDSYRALTSTPHENAWSTVGLNWENVSKRILPQIIYKGSVLAREEFCSAGLFLVTPKPVYDRILRRLGGEANVSSVGRLQPSSITFVAYDFDRDDSPQQGQPAKLEVVHTNMSTTAEVRDAFNRAQLPQENVYGLAISNALGVDFTDGSD